MQPVQRAAEASRHLHPGSGLRRRTALLRGRLREAPGRHARGGHDLAPGRRLERGPAGGPGPGQPPPGPARRAAAEPGPPPRRRWRIPGSVQLLASGQSTLLARREPGGPDAGAEVSGVLRVPVSTGRVHAGGQPARPERSACGPDGRRHRRRGDPADDGSDRGRADCRRSPGSCSRVRASPSRRRRTFSSSRRTGGPSLPGGTAGADRGVPALGRHLRARRRSDPSGHPGGGRARSRGHLCRSRRRAIRPALHRGRWRPVRSSSRARSSVPRAVPWRARPCTSRAPSRAEARATRAPDARPTTAPSSWRRSRRPAAGTLELWAIPPPESSAGLLRTTLQVPSGSPVTGTWTCPPRPSLRGTMFLPDGGPYAGASLRADPVAAADPALPLPPSGSPGVASESGTFALRLDPGTYQLEVQAAQGLPALRSVVQVPSSGAQLDPFQVPTGRHAHGPGAPRCRDARLAGAGAASTGR